MANDAALELDGLDRRIIALLQERGRATFDELGAAVSLSSSTVLRRVRRLEESGVISGYRATVDPRRVGLALSAYVNVSLEKQGPGKATALQEFRAAVALWPEVMDCVALTGEMDYLLRVAVQDMAHFSRFITDKLLAHPTVRDCKSSFVMDVLKAAAAVPV